MEYSAIFSSFFRGDRLARVVSVITAVLLPIILPLKVIFTLSVSSFTIFSDSGNAVFALEHFTFSLPPLILSVLEWIYLFQRRGYPITFCGSSWEWEGR